jgi:asparagine synthase (glutamine-hydrolysing)
MCGIAGFTTGGRDVPEADAVLRRMTNVLTPRGPDGEGYFRDADVALGHRRLSIIDLEFGAQPMEASEGAYRIIFNGEIYNYIELRADLEKRGVAFETTSDTEVLLKHWIIHGPDGIRELNGMFAFAIWDAAKKELFLVRDRIGIKPLYYSVQQGNLVFGSEMKSLLQHPDISRDMNKLSVSKFLTFGYVPSPHTIFKGVEKLDPGTWLRFHKGSVHKTMYWDIPLEDNPINRGTPDECAADFVGLMRDAIRKRLRSDVPVGVFLSGGIDSSLVTALAAQEAGRTIKTFSVGFEEASYDESPYAREVAAHCGTEHHHEVLSMKRAIDLLPQVLGTLDEPFADPSILPTYLLSQFTSSHVKVALGGDGGDELFAGYPAFQAHKITEKLTLLPRSWRDALTRNVRRIPVSHRYASAGFLLQQFFKGAGISPEIRFFLWLGCYGNHQKRDILSDDVQAELVRENPFEDIINYVRQSGLVSDFERILYLCTKLYLQDQILVKVDRASMANSLEVRVPFLDHNLVEYVSGIPSDYKLRGLTSKYLLKRAAKPYLPKRIIKRRKAGFMMPVATWLEQDLRPMVEDLCAPSELEALGLFKPDVVRKMLDDHFNHVLDYRKQIWPLICFMTWRRNYGFNG